MWCDRCGDVAGFAELIECADIGSMHHMEDECGHCQDDIACGNYHERQVDLRGMRY